jgi:hypothetical protein
MPFIFVVVEFGNNDLVDPFMTVVIAIVEVPSAIGA